MRPPVSPTLLGKQPKVGVSVRESAFIHGMKITGVASLINVLALLRVFVAMRIVAFVLLGLCMRFTLFLMLLAFMPGLPKPEY